jgi:hypothetical protein
VPVMQTADDYGLRRRRILGVARASIRTVWYFLMSAIGRRFTSAAMVVSLEGVHRQANVCCPVSSQLRR